MSARPAFIAIADTASFAIEPPHVSHPHRWTEEFVSAPAYETWLWRADLALKERTERSVLGSRCDSLHADGTEELKLGSWSKCFGTSQGEKC
ncbi:hypothetical protein VTH06DRAFT_4157 [Thermothelomyces fergusii]